MEIKQLIDDFHAWYETAHDIKSRLSDEAFVKTKAFIRELGREDNDRFIIDFDEDDLPMIVEKGCDYTCDIERIVLFKKSESIALFYGENEDEQYIRYRDLTLEDRTYIIKKLLTLIK